MELLAPASERWVIVITAAGALCVTGKPDDTSEDDSVVTQAFEEYHRRRPGDTVNHVVLCLHVHDRRSRGLSVTLDGERAPPTREELRVALLETGPNCILFNISTDKKLSGSEVDPIQERLLIRLLHMMSRTVAELHTVGVIRLHSDG